MRQILHEFRLAARGLLRAPGFSLSATVVLTLAIGSLATVFGVVDAVLLRALPYRDPGRLMAIETRRSQQPEIDPFTSPAAFYDLRARTRAFESLLGIDPVWNMVLTGRGEAEQIKALYVSATFFPMLGVQPMLGRAFTAAEDSWQTPREVALVSYGFWRRRLGGGLDAIGQKLALDGSVYEVIGVMPRGFRYEGEPIAGTATDIDIYAPLAVNPLTSAARPRTGWGSWAPITRSPSARRPPPSCAASSGAHGSSTRRAGCWRWCSGARSSSRATSDRRDPRAAMPSLRSHRADPASEQ